jgi:hypothetical protein
MRQWGAMTASAILLFATLNATQATSQMPGAPTPASIDAVAWMAGHWVGTGSDDLSEEVWLQPAAGSMAGMWRWARGGTTRLYELLAIAIEDDRLVLRVRHFLPNLHGLEEKDEPIALPAVRLEARGVVFEGAYPKGPLRITYRSPDPGRLEATVERDGRTDTFTYVRR